MAKWGEGDPRWIVEDRPDATNVNNWHWSEKNASSWSKDKLKSLMEGLVLSKKGLGTVTLKTLSKCEGEATANNRKGKLIFFYEWVLTIDWVAELEDPDAEECKGTLEIPNLSEENEPSDVDVNVSVSAGGSFGEQVKTYLRTEGTTIIRDKLACYLTSLREEYAQDLILPTTHSAKTASTQSKTATTTCTPKTADNSVNSAISPLSSMQLKSQQPTASDTKDLSLRQTFKCRVQELYNVFTIPEMVTAFTRNSVTMEVAEGGKFELFGGNVLGIFETFEPNKLIVQKWRFKTWPDGLYSTVRLDFAEKEDCTELTLTQANIPVSDYERTREGWNTYYWESIKRTFGFGATLM
ncbi:activator of 90 kDa heat shock protein ATPase homolog 1 [Hyalella azteca]|uniref:Activator of 90 kDa heat shock protein ATPase homolog 1 n=1 Tax=Hyalella azteca TaxID=294128 RepID=A0A8B7N9F0_HYAAZ|nr:activator of 90 kDa heat shock protein ATPase homolog 1 [Hyalella azteca]